MVKFMQKAHKKEGEKGFTLIELSIVLVIIGLIVGGVLVGQDLIRAAEVRAQITQIEKYNTAVNTFRGKYNSIPGDMNNVTAQQFGFANGTCSGNAGQRDGNGLVDGEAGIGSFLQGGGETGLFWGDMSNGGMTQYVDGSFTLAGCSTTPSPGITQVNTYIPVAKMGRGNYVYVYETGGLNYYGLSYVSGIAAGVLTSSISLSVLQAYNIDKKMDDGLPSTGNVQANYLTAGAIKASTTAAAASSSTCYDTASSNYDLTYNAGNGVNCAMSFLFQ